MLAVALKKLRQACEGQDLSSESAPFFYDLARVLQDDGQLQEAVDLYERILAFDIQYQDAARRLETARQRLRMEGARQEGANVRRRSDQRYKIVGELGRGGMGIVYKAVDTVLDREVAYKVLPETLKENAKALQNFLREAKSAAQLNHPNIVTVYDAGEQGGQYYIAMEFVDGTTVKEIIKRKGIIKPRGVLHVIAQMCEALEYAHAKGIVHRDIKTANTMWAKDKKAKIMDFGLAKAIEEVRNHTTMVSGTPFYMSPEQTLGKNIDHRTDIYSLGVSIFEMSTGRVPFREGNVPYHHVHTPPPDPCQVNPKLPQALGKLISRCLKKDPGERYQTAGEILVEVRAALTRRDEDPSEA
jgi:serine/threonine-protein kinase